MISEMINLFSLAVVYFRFVGDKSKLLDLVYFEFEN